MRRWWAVLCWGCLPLWAEAAFVVGNLTQAGEGDVGVSISQWQASSFEISAGSVSWDVRGVTLHMREIVPNAHLTLRIVGESSFRPDLADVWVRFSIPATLPSAAGNVRFDAVESGKRSLEPGRRYWLVLGVMGEDLAQTPSTGLYFWSYVDDSGPDAGTFADWSFGSLTASSGALGQNWEASETTPFSFSVDAVPVVPAMTLARWRSFSGSMGESDESFRNSDSDENGWVGLLDFAFDGRRSFSPKVTVGEDGVWIEYVRWLNAPELEYVLEVSDGLGSWENAAMEEIVRLIDYDRESVKVRLPPGFGRVCVRLGN